MRTWLKTAVLALRALGAALRDNGENMRRADQKVFG
jgi:uncharacterized protein YukE